MNNQTLIETEQPLSVYFMKGDDPRMLSQSQQKQIFQFVKQDPFSKSFYVYNQNSCKKRIYQWKKKLPWIDCFYAVKCNPDPNLLLTLVNLGVGFDCASSSQMNTVIQLGQSPKNIIYSNTFEIRKTAQMGILKWDIAYNSRYNRLAQKNSQICSQYESALEDSDLALIGVPKIWIIQQNTGIQLQTFYQFRRVRHY